MFEKQSDKIPIERTYRKMNACVLLGMNFFRQTKGKSVSDL